MNNYRSDIDGLRGLSIILVIFYHLELPFFNLGYLGVDIFFVLSGFLICQILINEIIKNNKINLLNFFIRRARRILPNLFLISLIVSIFSYFFLLPVDFKNFGRSLFSSIFFLSNFYFYFKADYFDTPVINKPLIHTWSLSIEEQFYIVFPIILLIIYRIKKYVHSSDIFFLLIISFIPIILVFFDILNYNFFLTYFRIYEILIGCFLASFLNSKIYSRIISNYKYIIDIFFISYTLIILTLILNNLVYDYLYNFFLVIFIFLLILKNSYDKKLIYKILSFKPLVFIGLISYGLYLWHWPILVFIKYMSFKLNLFELSSIVIFSSFFLSLLFYHFYENPIRKKIIFKSNLSFISFILIFFTSLFIYSTLIISNKLDSVSLTEKQKKIYELSSKKENLDCEHEIINSSFSICNEVDNNNQINTIIWGDSHAALFAHHLSKFFKKNNLKFGFNNCLPIFFTSTFNNKNNNKCQNIHNELIDIIKKYKVKNLIISSYWSQYIIGIDTKQKGAGLSDNLYFDINSKLYNSSEALDIFKRNFLKTIQIISKENVNIWLVQEIPSFKFWVPNEAMRHIKYLNILDIKRPYSDYLFRVKNIENFFYNFKNIKLINPSIKLCDNQFCYGNVNDSILYSDFNHLNKSGLDYIDTIFNEFKMYAISN